MKKTFILTLIILLSIFTLRAATVTFTLTNSLGQPDTNAIKVFPISAYINADGSVQTTGLPFLIKPNTNGFASTNLLAGNYLATNYFLCSQYGIPATSQSFGTTKGIIFAVPASAGTYTFGQLAISGYNVFNYNGTAFVTTYSNIVAALGYIPLSPSATNGLITGSVTNGLATTNFVAGYSYPLYGNPSNYTTPSVTNGLASTNYANSLTNGFVTAGITNGFATITFVNTNIQGSTNGLASTNFVTSQGYVTSSITNGFISTNSLVGLVNSNQLAGATNTIATNQAANLIATNNVLVAALNAQVVALNAQIATSSNYLAQTKQPSSAILSNISVNGVYTNGIAAGTNITIQTNFGNITYINAATQSFLTNGMTGIVYMSPLIFLQTNSLPGLTNGFVTGSITNGLLSSSATNGLATTNFVGSSISASNVMMASLTQVVASNAAVLAITTNLIAGATNAMATTNQLAGLSTTNNVNNATNGLWQSVIGYSYPLGSNPSNYVNESKLNGTSNVLASVIISTNNSLAAAIIYSNSIAIALATNYVNSLTNYFITQSNSQYVLLSNGVARMLTISNQMSFWTKTNFLLTTNVIGILGNAGGTYLFDGSSTWTNALDSRYSILLSGSIYYLNSNAVTLYSSPDVINWSIVTGPAFAPLGSWGSKWDMNGVQLIGSVYSSNLIYQIRSNAMQLINQFAINPTNGIYDYQATNIANYLINESNIATRAETTNTINHFIVASNLTSKIDATNISSAMIGYIILSNTAPGFYVNGTTNWFGTNGFIPKNYILNLNGRGTNITISNSIIIAGLSTNLVLITPSVSNLLGGTITFGVDNLNSNFSPYSTIAGGYKNTISNDTAYNFIGSGFSNVIDQSSVNCFIGSGSNNINSLANYSAIVSGYNNYVWLPLSFGEGSSMIGSGNNNSAFSFNSFIGAGIYNLINLYSENSFIGGGSSNTIDTSSTYSFIGGGCNNFISQNADYSVIVGGLYNIANGSNSFAAGSYATADTGCFVWSDISTSSVFGSAAINTFIVRAANGAAINTNDPGTNALKVVGNIDSTVGFTINGVPISGTSYTLPSYVLTNKNTSLASLIGGVYVSNKLTVDGYVGGGDHGTIDMTGGWVTNCSGIYGPGQTYNSSAARIDIFGFGLFDFYGNQTIDWNGRILFYTNNPPEAALNFTDPTFLTASISALGFNAGATNYPIEVSAVITNNTTGGFTMSGGLIESNTTTHAYTKITSSVIQVSDSNNASVFLVSNGTIYANGQGLTNVPFYIFTNLANTPINAGGMAFSQGFGLIRTWDTTNIGGTVVASTTASIDTNVVVPASTLTNTINNLIAAAAPVIYYRYNTTNISGFTNKYGVTNYISSSTAPATQFYHSYTKPVAGTYIGCLITTNVTSLNGAVNINVYIAGVANGAGPAASLHSEIYYSTDNGATLKGDWDGDVNDITIGSTNLYRMTVNNPSTNFGSPVMLLRFFKMDTMNNANIWIFGGNGTSSYYQFSGQGTNSGGGGGDVYLANNNVFTGTNQFYQPLIVTNPANGWLQMGATSMAMHNVGDNTNFAISQTSLYTEMKTVVTNSTSTNQSLIQLRNNGNMNLICNGSINMTPDSQVKIGGGAPLVIVGTNTANYFQVQPTLYNETDFLMGGTLGTNTAIQLITAGSTVSATVNGSLTANSLIVPNSINQTLAFVDSSNCLVNWASMVGNVNRTYLLSLTNNVTFTLTNATANTDFSWETVQAGAGAFTATLNTNYVAGGVKLSPPTFGQLVTHPTGVGARMLWSVHVWSTGTNATVWQLPMTSGL